MTTLLLFAGGTWLALVVFLFVMQDRLVFPGAGFGARPLPPTTPAAVVDSIGDGDERRRVLTLPRERPNAVVLYFGGNGEDLALAAYTMQQLARFGGEVLCVEHPGFGASAGRPSKAALLATAERAAERARQLAAARDVPLVVVGSSLGTFCAMHVGAGGGVARMVLRAPPTTLAAAARSRFWWLPVGLLLRHDFDNLANAGRVPCPVLVVHGDEDTIVPLALGRQLAAALPHGELVVAAGRGHNDLDLLPDGPAGPRLREFLAP